MSAPRGFTLLDGPSKEAKVIKRVNENITVKVRAYQETKGLKFYVSQWSYERIAQGHAPNFLFLNTGEPYFRLR